MCKIFYKENSKMKELNHAVALGLAVTENDGCLHTDIKFTDDFNAEDKVYMALAMLGLIDEFCGGVERNYLIYKMKFK